MPDIPFIQYLRPDGRQVPVTVEMPQEISDLAQSFIEAGGWFECEHLITNHVSLTACWSMPDGNNDIAIQVVENGPEVINAVEKIIRTAIAKYNTGQLP